MKKMIIALLLLLSLSACGKAEPSEPLDMGALLPEKVTEVRIVGFGETVSLTEQGEVAAVTELLHSIELREDESADISAPGAVSFEVKLIHDGGEFSVTYPVWEYEGRVYSAQPESVKLFEGYFA